MRRFHPAPRDLGSAVLIGLAASFLSGACGKDPASPAPDEALSTDRLYIPAPEVRRSVDLGSSAEAARAAQREIHAVLNFSRILLTRVETPARRVRGLPWTWESDGCSWIRTAEATACFRVVTACDGGQRIAWREARDGTCGYPPRAYDDAVVLWGWSAPFGRAGRLSTCSPADTMAVEDRVEWEVPAGTATVRWRLRETRPGLDVLRMTLERTLAPDGAETCEFVLPDSFRWVGQVEARGLSGEITAYRWRPARGGWVARDEFTWTPGRGRWIRYGDAGTSETLSWGPPSLRDGTISLTASAGPGIHRP
jgi:hypothetical protein